MYGIEHGGSRRNNFVLKTQEQLAKEMDMDVRTLQNYKMLADMIPELEELVDTGVTTPTTALAIIKNLSNDEQSPSQRIHLGALIVGFRCNKRLCEEMLGDKDL